MKTFATKSSIFFLHKTVVFTFSVLLFLLISGCSLTHFRRCKCSISFLSNKCWRKLATNVVEVLHKKKSWPTTEIDWKKQKTSTKHEVNLWHPYERHNRRCLHFWKENPVICRANFHELASLHSNSKIFFIYENLKPIFWDISMQECLSQPKFFRKFCAAWNNSRKFVWSGCNVIS